MIGHVSTGKSFAGLARYLEHGAGGVCPPDRVTWVETRNLLARDISGAAQEMQDEARLSERVRQPVYHVVSFDPEDTVDKALMIEVADRVLSDFHLAQHQALMVAHGDTYYEHVHLMINRVNWVTAEASKTAFDYYRLEKTLRELERELGLKETPGRHFRLDGQPYVGRGAGLRLGRELRQHARNAVRQARSWQDLENRLAREGLTLHVARKALYITDGARTERAGALMRGGSLAKLEERFGQRFESLRRETVGDVLPETYQETMMEAADQETHTGFGSEQGSGQAEQSSYDTSHAPSASEAGGAPGGNALRSVLNDLYMHSELVKLGARRSDLIRGANVLEAALAGLQERMEGLRAQDAQLDRYFREMYRAGGRARAVFDADAVLVGPSTAAERLRKAPEAFGELRGGKGLLLGAERQRALEAAQAASTLGRAYHAELKRLSEESQRVHETPVREGARNGRSTQQPVEQEKGSAWPEVDQDSSFYRKLEVVYQNPDRAHQAYEQLEQRLGPQQAARALMEHPEALGPLRSDGVQAAQMRSRVLQAAAAGVERSRITTTEGCDPLVYRDRTAALQAELKRVQAEIGGINDRLAVLPNRRALEQSITRKMATLAPDQRADLIRRVGEMGAALAKTTVGVALRAAELAARAVTRQAMGRDVFER